MDKQWWARVTDDRSDYGRWVPTGCVDKDDALYYIRVYYRAKGYVKEWLQL